MAALRPDRECSNLSQPSNNGKLTAEKAWNANLFVDVTYQLLV
jgi:hypothetical protein